MCVGVAIQVKTIVEKKGSSHRFSYKAQVPINLQLFLGRNL